MLFSHTWGPCRPPLLGSTSKASAQHQFLPLVFCPHSLSQVVEGSSSCSFDLWLPLSSLDHLIISQVSSLAQLPGSASSPHAPNKSYLWLPLRATLVPPEVPLRAELCPKACRKVRSCDGHKLLTGHQPGCSTLCCSEEHTRKAQHREFQTWKGGSVCPGWLMAEAVPEARSSPG